MGNEMFEIFSIEIKAKIISQISIQFHRDLNTSENSDSHKSEF